MQYIHYHNDFTVPISLVADSITIDPAIIGSITFYTRKQGNTYCCCWDCKTLYKEGDYVYAVINEHNLEAGVLKYIVEYQIPDNNYPDKHQKICQHYTSDIELTKENGDITVADAQIIYGETIEELIESAGYSYTKDEIDDMIAGLGSDGIVVNKTNWAADVLSANNTRYIIADALNFSEVTNLPVGDNCEITFLTSGSFGNNVNLQINNAYIDAPLRQIFNGTKITGFFHNSQIPVEWFGAKGDGETDDADAINTTIKYAGKSEVLLSAPIYMIGSTIHICEDNANFDTYEGQIEAAKSEEGGKKFLCKGSIYSTSNFTGYTTKNVRIPVMVRLAASNATVRIEGAIVVHSDLTDCIGFFHQGYHDNKVYIARIMKGRDYIGYWNWLDGTENYTNQAAMNLGTCDGVVYVYAMGGDFECEQICGFNNGFMVSDKYTLAYAAVQQASFKFASLSANYGIRVQVGNNDGLLKKNTRGWFNACRVEYNGISGEQEGQRFLPSTDSTFIKVDSSNNTVTFCQNRFICNSVEPMWYKLMDINIARGDYFEFLGNYGDCHTITYNNGIPNASKLGTSAPTVCYNGGEPYTSTNKFINIRNAKDILINTVTEYYAMPYDTIFVEDSQNVVFTNCQSAKYLKNTYYQYDRNHRRFDKVIFTTSNELDNNSEDVTVFEVDKRELDKIKYVNSTSDIDTTVDGLYVITTPAFSSRFKLYPLYEVLSGVSTQLGYCYDNVGMITSHNELIAALDNVTVDAYTKAQTDSLLAGKANKNGNTSETFTVNALNLTREGAATTFYNYSNDSGEYISFYDKTGGSLNYKFTDNQGDNIATERQLSTKANSADVYTKTDIDNKGYLTSETDPTVPAWAKSPNKPTYTASEVGALPDSTVIPTKVSQLTNDSGFTTNTGTITEIKMNGSSKGTSGVVNLGTIVTAETDPTVPSWAKASTKPTYTASEVGALPDTTVIPTVDSSLTGSTQTNPVQGGAIYTALQGKAGYKYYGTYQAMTSDNTQPNGTIGYEGDNEGFYVYDSGNAEWKPIDQTGGGSGDGKQVTYINVSVKSSRATFTDLDGNTLTLQQSLDLLKNKEKDLVLIYSNNYYNIVSISDEDYYLNITFAAATNAGTAGFRFLELSYCYEPGSEDTYITASNTVNNIPNALNYFGSGYFNTNGSSTTAIAASSSYPFSYVVGGILIGNFNVNVGAKATLNISSKGAKPIYYQNAAIQAGVINSGDKAIFQYYNNRFNLICTDHPASGSGVQSNLNETDTTSLAYTQNKSTIPNKTANTNIDQMPAAVDGVSTVELTPGYNLMPTSFWETDKVNFMLSEATYSNEVAPEFYIYIPKNSTATATTSITFDWSSNADYSYVELYWEGGTAPDIIGNSTNYQIIKLILISDQVALGEQYIYS